MKTKYLQQMIKPLRLIACSSITLLALTAHQATAQCVAPPIDIIAWWPAETNTDDIVNGNNGTAVGGVAYATGEVGDAFDLNGSSSYVSVPASPTLDFGSISNYSGVTIEAWVKPKADCNAPVIEWDSSSIDGLDFWVGNDASQLLVGFRDPAGTMHAFVSNFNFDTNSFQHIAVTYNTNCGCAVLYYNGLSVASADIGSFVPQTSYTSFNANIGRRLGQPIGDGDTFDGLIDELSVYSRALSPCEVQAIYNAGTDGKCK